MKVGLKKKVVLLIIVGLLPLDGDCFEILNVLQGLMVAPGGKVVVTLKVKTDGTDETAHYGIIGVLVPNDWSVDKVMYDGDYGPDEGTFLPPGTSDNEPGGVVDLWTAALETQYPSGDDMQWVVYQGNTAYAAALDPAYLDVTIEMTAGATEGEFNLGYCVTSAWLDFNDPSYYSTSLENPIEVTNEPGTLLFSEIAVHNTAKEFFEIFNPTSEPIDLSNYYVSDATYANGGWYYYNIVTGTEYGGGGYGDFHARFPDGAMIAPGEYQTVALNGDSDFVANYDMLPTYEIAEDGAPGDDAPDMREAVEGSVDGIGSGLTNGDEVLVLYYWDGMSDLVQDVDYLLWDDGGSVPNEAVSKTGIALDGPDADADASAYLDDTAIENQKFFPSPGLNLSAQRIDFFEGNEIKTSGNGLTGQDETSENIDETWISNVPSSPNAAYSSTIADLNPPYTDGHNPAKEATEVAINTKISVQIRDDISGVDQSSIVMTVNNKFVTPVITGSNTDLTLTYNPPTNFDYNQTIYVRINASDLAGNSMSTDSYSFSTLADLDPPFTDNADPANGAIEVPINSNITIYIKDAISGIDQASIAMKVNGATVTPTITGSTEEYKLTYDPSNDFQYNQTITVSIDATDNIGNQMITEIYSFSTIVDLNPPYTEGHSPAKEATEVAINTKISVQIKDDISGVDQTTISMHVNGDQIASNYLTISGTPQNHTVQYNPSTVFNFEETVNVVIEATDLAGNQMLSDTYTFQTADRPTTRPATTSRLQSGGIELCDSRNLFPVLLA